MAVFTAMAFIFMPLLAPTNPMTYDTAQFYNCALAIVVGCGVAPRGISPVAAAVAGAADAPPARPHLARPAPPRDRSPCRRRRRIGTAACTAGSRHCRTRPSRCSARNCLAALSVGSEIIQLRHMAPRLGAAAELDAALEAFAQGNSAVAIARLRQLDRRLASAPDAGPETAIALRARGRILVISEALAEHAAYFDAGAPA